MTSPSRSPSQVIRRSHGTYIQRTRQLGAQRTVDDLRRVDRDRVGRVWREQELDRERLVARPRLRDSQQSSDAYPSVDHPLVGAIADDPRARPFAQLQVRNAELALQAVSERVSAVERRGARCLFVVEPAESNRS